MKEKKKKIGQLSYLFLLWLLYPNISNTDTISSAKGDFALQIKLQPAPRFILSKWQPLDYNLPLLPNHAGTGGNSIKSRLYKAALRCM